MKFNNTLVDADSIIDNGMQISEWRLHYTYPWEFKGNLENQSVTNSFVCLSLKFRDYLETVKNWKDEGSFVQILDPSSILSFSPLHRQSVFTLILKFYVALEANYCSLLRGRYGNWVEDAEVLKVNIVSCNWLRVMQFFCFQIWECIEKFPDWPPGARTVNCTALCH